MSERRRIYRDGDGVRRTMIWDDEDPDQFTVHTEQVIDEIVDGVARDQEIHAPRGDNKLAARIPLFVAEDLMRRGIYGDEDAFKAWLNSSEAAPWRIWKGAL